MDPQGSDSGEYRILGCIKKGPGFIPTLMEWPESPWEKCISASKNGDVEVGDDGV